MQPLLARFHEPAYALMRIVFGALFACHGAQKLFGAFGGQAQLGNPMMLAAGVIELAGGLLIAVGLFASIAAFVCSGQMAVAYFMVHFPRGFWPIENGGELAALYSFAFLFVAARGAGAWSIDAARRRRRA